MGGDWVKKKVEKSTKQNYMYKGNPIGERWPVNFDNPYWSKKLRMDYLQRRIIVYSIQYYEMSDTCVTDKYYDAVSQQLLWYMRNTDIDEQKRTTYWYCMSDFDGSTGFDIYSRLDKYDKKYLSNIAEHVLYSFKHSKLKHLGRKNTQNGIE